MDVRKRIKGETKDSYNLPTKSVQNTFAVNFDLKQDKVQSGVKNNIEKVPSITSSENHF